VQICDGGVWNALLNPYTEIYAGITGNSGKYYTQDYALCECLRDYDFANMSDFLSSGWEYRLSNGTFGNKKLP
jgi:hypothetical protein